MTVEQSLSEVLLRERFLDDVQPVRLVVPNSTWTDLKKMGVDPAQCHFEFIDDGTHIPNAFFGLWGWWKTTILGFYPYTELRDYEAHARQGIGRPWLSMLEEKHQELIFRELYLLLQEWNRIVDDAFIYTPSMNKDLLPDWMKRWLSLTNESYTKGILEAERSAFESCHTENRSHIFDFVTRYKYSERTWRPMMPERAVFHQKYGSRLAFWTFTR